MRFDEEELLKPKPETVVIDITYNKEKGNLENSELQDSLLETWQTRAANYVKKFDWTIAKSMKEALIARANRNKLMTVREADICLRKGTSLSNEFIINSLLGDFGTFIVEDDTGENDVYQQRLRYNKGIDWKFKSRATASQDAKEAGDKLLAKIAQDLAANGLPLHADELDNGFPDELLRPEYHVHKPHRRAKETATA